MGEVSNLKPLVLGYALLAPHTRDAQYTALQAKLSEFAHKAGLMLGVIYFERPSTSPAAYVDLLAAIERHNATGVVVPSLTHFGDRPDERVKELEDNVGVVVYAADANVHDIRD